MCSGCTGREFANRPGTEGDVGGGGGVMGPAAIMGSQTK